MRNDLTARYVRSILRYDARKGQMFWRVGRGNAKAGSRAGTMLGSGYRSIMIDRVRYQEHRLIWLYVKGRWPRKQIDHRDTRKTNNRFSNFRPANSIQQQGNTRIRRDSRSRTKGVYWNRTRNKWQVQIRLRSKKTFIGRFTARRKAKAAYDAAAVVAFGEFARAA